MQKRKNDPRYAIEHMAVNMYSERVTKDTQKGKGEMYRANPDARALYFKGINDTIACIEVWAKEAPVATLSNFLEALHKQTDEAGQIANQ